MIEAPEIIEVKSIRKETSEHYTITFVWEKAKHAKPGQFFMVWLPRQDEKPISVSKVGANECQITVQAKGIWSNKLCENADCEKIGLRGPYGNGFSTKGIKKCIIVAGGCGAAPLRPLVEKVISEGIQTSLILGARTSNSVLFKKEFKEKLGDKLFITTDDGSEGEKGFVTTVLERLLAKKKPNCVYCCGPEVMMKAIFDICEKNKVQAQMSLERYMKCGYGICGQCAMDDLLVCKDGPVFFSEQLRKSKEFGKIARLRSGKEVTLKEYADWRQQ